MSVTVVGSSRAHVSAAWVTHVAQRAMRAVRRTGADASVSFVTESEIATLNARYRKKRGPTDVLSFSADGGPRVAGKAELGDVVISPVSARRKAIQRVMPYRRYLALLIVHGILHLVGMDHERSHEAERMERLEQRILKDRT
jgi:rRNA maturation RNase YbeY